MQEFYTLVTNIGGAAIANATILGKKVNITDFAVGDGNGSYYTPNADMIKLKNEVWRGRPTNVKIDEKNANVMTVSTVIPAEIGGFTIREMGLFSEDGKLIAVSNCPDVQKVTLNTGVASELELTIQIAVSNVETVEFNIDPTVIIATRKDVEKLENPEFDDSGEVEEISSFNSFIESVKSKMNIFQFFRNFKAGMKYVLHTGMIVNNFTSERGDLPGSAANDKRLYDMIDDVNKNIPQIAHTFNYLADSQKFEQIIASFEQGVYFEHNEELQNLIGAYWQTLIAHTMPDKGYSVQQLFGHGGDNKMAYRIKTNDSISDWKTLVTNSDFDIIQVTQDMIVANRITLKDDHTNQIIKVGNIRILNTYFTANVDSDIHMAILSISEKPSLAICREFLSLSNQRFEAFLGYGHDLEIRYLKTGDEYGVTLIWTV